MQKAGPKTILFVFLVCILDSVFAQEVNFGEPMIWTSNKEPVIKEDLSKFNSDLIILDEQTEFTFYNIKNEKISRNVLFKINSLKGLEKLTNFRLPESFDIALDAYFNRQGRNSVIKTPYIYDFNVTAFAVRKFSNHKWVNIPVKVKYDQVRRVKPSGEFVKDEMSTFSLQKLEVGDIVEIYYESEFVSNYGSNLFYFNSIYPKLHCEYTFRYRINKEILGYSFLLPVNISDSAVSKSVVKEKDYDIFTDKISLKNLKGINFPINSFGGGSLPHVFVDFTMYRILLNSYPSGGTRVYDYQFVRPKNFEWIYFADTTNQYTKIYDKHFSAIRKFSSTLPPTGSDSLNKIFFRALCDTLSSFRFITSNQLFYNESNLYDISSGDHLLKRRLTERSLETIYKDILNDNKIFYYEVNIQAKRLGEHIPSSRAHYAYERNLIAVPNKESYIYFMRRNGGVKYFLGELPFYFEGSLGALSPRNFQENMKNREATFYKFIKTHKGTFNENTRTENATVKISIDSSYANFNIKESLSGQFSTVLRHLYLNEIIDSTISPHYFKKCVDKPYAGNVKVKLSSRITDYPFRYTFNCSEKINTKSKSSIDLKDWFSFTLSKNIIPEKPNHDFYFDFDLSDSYNFLLDFGKPVLIKNAADFTKTISNEYFELQSEIVKNSESNYLMKVKVQIKQMKLPDTKADLLMNLVSALDELNNFALLLESN